MIREVILRQVGNSVVITLPEDMVDRLQVGAGDKLYAIETDRGILLTAYEPDLNDAIAAFDDVRRQYRSALKKLAE